MSAAHTPTPWRFVEGGAFNKERWGAIVAGDPERDDERGEETVAEVCAGNAAEADAAFIVRACNAHDELIAALSGLVNAIGPMPARSRESIEAYKRAQIILAKVQP